MLTDRKVHSKIWDVRNAREDLSIGAELIFILPVLENIPGDDFVAD
jgi:hypothetical protein